jgi:hypothetical protein
LKTPIGRGWTLNPLAPERRFAAWMKTPAAGKGDLSPQGWAQLHAASHLSATLAKQSQLLGGAQLGIFISSSILYYEISIFKLYYHSHHGFIIHFISLLFTSLL